MLRGVLLGLSMALVAMPVAAQEMQPGAGTLTGILAGTKTSYRLGDRLRIRTDTIWLDANILGFDARSDDLNFDADMRWRSGGAMLDFLPGGEGFRLSAGVRFTGERAWIETPPVRDVATGLRLVTPAKVGKPRAKYRIRDWAPAATIGYVIGIAPRLALGVEAGAVFLGAPRIRRLRSIGDRLSAASPVAAGPAPDRTTIENDIDDYRLHPMMQLSFGYRF